MSDIKDKKVVKKEEDEDDDEVDGLFGGGGDDEDEETEYDEEMQKKMEEAKKRLEKKQKKSQSVLQFGINPTGTEIDLMDLAENIKKKIVKDGITWGEKANTRPLAFGLYVLVLMCTIVDSKVDVTNDIEEAIAEIEGVASVKIDSWQKK